MGEILEIVNDTKLFGTTISNDLKWEKKTQSIVRKANKRMEILKRLGEGTKKCIKICSGLKNTNLIMMSSDF